MQGMPMIRINLTTDHQVTAAMAGLFRAVNYIPQWEEKSPSFPRKRQYGQPTFPELVTRQTEAFGAEIAVALYLNQPIPEWHNRNYKIKADVGSNIEVKWASKEVSPLYIQSWDRDDDVAVLVVGSAPTYYIVGWMPIAVAKQAKYKNSQNVEQNNFIVTQINLQDMETLVRSKYGTALV